MATRAPGRAPAAEPAGAARDRFAAFAISAYVAALMTTTVADVLAIYATLPFFAAGMAFALTG
ncbi:MAG: hypothetical protein WAL59_10925 [Roseiarcus sp.]